MPDFLTLHRKVSVTCSGKTCLGNVARYLGVSEDLRPSVKGLCAITVCRWSIPLGARRIMEAMDGHKNSLSSRKMVALAAGLSVGATVCYLAYQRISRASSCEQSCNTSEFCCLCSVLVYWLSSVFCHPQVRGPTSRCPR